MFASALRSRRKENVENDRGRGGEKDPTVQNEPGRMRGVRKKLG